MAKKTSKKQGGEAKAYARAGVNIDLGDRLKAGLKQMLRSARRPEVIGTVGGFGGLFDLSQTRLKRPVLVSSIDSVGTKVKVAFATGRHDVVGQDIVNHCANDIAVMGAEPLFFLDYMGMGRLEPGVFKRLIAGMAKACAASGCALIGGETAQLPGLYKPGEYDLVGSIVGAVEKDRILTGAAIRPGDRLIGLASSGLHTNGYSLAQRVLFEKLGLKLEDRLPGTRLSVADALLKVHVNYGPLLQRLLKAFNAGPARIRRGNSIFGLCHITGGGFSGNLPRVLPENCGVRIETSSWSRPAIFNVLAEQGGVGFDELHEVFNMGIGMILVVAEESVARIQEACRRERVRSFVIGEVSRQKHHIELVR